MRRNGIATRMRGAWQCLAVIALAAALVFAGFPASDAANAASESPSATPTASSSYAAAVDADSWTQVAGRVADQLDTVLAEYADGDRASAAAAARSAYNSIYKASLLDRVISEQDSDLSDSLNDQFTQIAKLARTEGNDEELSQAIGALNDALSQEAAALDADDSIASPRDYSDSTTQKISDDREQISATSQAVHGSRGDRSWTDIATEMNGLLDQAMESTRGGDGRAGSDLVNTAYYEYYELLGFEKTVMTAISGGRVSQVENQFKQCRKDMVGTSGKSIDETQKDVDQLKSWLLEDAGKLDGGAAESGSTSGASRFTSSMFGQAFIILLREGLEAILVVAAIIAYLVKTGNKDKTKFIYLGLVLGLVASGVMAVILDLAVGSTSGRSQEIIEGVAALIAMCMLFFTSNWMLEKSSVESWNRYVKDKTETSVNNGSVASLASLSFLAVFREGAETVLFYQAISGIAAERGSMWAGAIAAAVILVIVFLIIRFTSVKIPLRPFFVITSILMAVMVVTFAGGGLHALIEGDVLDGTYLDGWPTNTTLGIYPYRETLIFQLVMAVLVIAVLIWAQAKVNRQDREARAQADAAEAKGPATGANSAKAAAKDAKTVEPDTPAAEPGAKKPAAEPAEK